MRDNFVGWVVLDKDNKVADFDTKYAPSFVGYFEKDAPEAKYWDRDWPGCAPHRVQRVYLEETVQEIVDEAAEVPYEFSDPEYSNAGQMYHIIKEIF